MITVKNGHGWRNAVFEIKNVILRIANKIMVYYPSYGILDQDLINEELRYLLNQILKFERV